MYFELLAILLYAVVFQACANSSAQRTRRQAADCLGRGNALETSICDRVIPIPDEIRQDFSLDPFYHNYNHAYGIPILSSDKVSEAAMKRACYTVRFMLADRRDIRNAMHDNCARFSIIGLTERTTEIPEHSHFPEYFDGRARGIGGTFGNPVTTTAEENLLCYSWEVDRWHDEDIAVHEFAHAVDKIGMHIVDPSFSTRLKDEYDNAIESGLWVDTYAASHRQEYYAEGVQKFFEVDVNQTYTDGVHNHINTRAELLQYDPALYGLALETFPCGNIIVDRCDNQDLIESRELLMNCDETTTLGVTTTIATEALTTKVSTETPTTNIPTETLTTNAPTETATTNIPTEVVSTNVLTTELTTQMLTGMKTTTTTAAKPDVTTTVATEALTKKVSTETPTTNIPTEALTTDAPTETSTTNMSTEVVSTNVLTTELTTQMLTGMKTTTTTATTPGCFDNASVCRIYKRHCKSPLVQKFCRKTCKMCRT